MSETDLFTAKVFQVKNDDRQTDDSSPNHESGLVNRLDFIDEHPNMVSARVIKGRMVEFEHSNLYGQSVRFKTIVNYDRILDPTNSLGVILRPQEGYVAKLENRDSNEEN